MTSRFKDIDQSEAHGSAREERQKKTTLPAAMDLQLTLRAARSNCTILITGETGVGKGYVARWIHSHSQLRRGPYIPVNCGAIPDALIDSQLFGHAKGAFTGASQDHLGLVRAAEGGTLLLDEISELPSTAQNRLLHLLQDREVQPVGMSRPVKVDVRVIAATNIDLVQAVAEQKFREDLLFRLDVIRLHVKPLRERQDELVGLLATFNDEFAELYKQEPLIFDDDVLEMLLSYPWPGNIRQLRTLVERLHVLCPGEEITVDHIADMGQLRPPPSVPNGLEAVERMKMNEIRRVLSESGGSITKAAATIGVHRSTIYRWLRGH